MNTLSIPDSCKLTFPSIRNLQHVGGWFAVLFALLFFLTLTGQPADAMGPTRQRPGDTESGKASWYGSEQGRHTASGERFNTHALTAAHRHLPFGTIVRVTNQLNGRSVEVRINDRGPWRHGRVIDVTSAAADILQMKKQGTVPVTIEIIKLGLPGRHEHADD
jgi:rare lipoprotein A